MGRTAYTEPQCLYKNALYLYLIIIIIIIRGRVAQSVLRLSYGLDGPGIESRWG